MIIRVGKETGDRKKRKMRMRIKHLRLAAAISETDHVTAMSRFNRSEPTAETVSPAEAPERRSRTRAELTALTYIRTPDLESKTMRFSHRRPPALLESTMSASSVASSMRLETPSPSPSPSHKRDVVDGRKFAEGMPLFRRDRGNAVRDAVVALHSWQLFLIMSFSVTSLVWR